MKKATDDLSGDDSLSSGGRSAPRHAAPDTTAADEDAFPELFDTEAVDRPRRRRRALPEPIDYEEQSEVPAWDPAIEVEELAPSWRQPTTELAWQNYLAEHDVPETPHLGGRILFRALFTTGLVIAVWLWWHATPMRSLYGTGPTFTAAGRITGLLSGYLMLTQVLLMSRVGWLERWVGGHNLMVWHRELGGALLVLVLGHVACILVGYAALEHVSLAREALNLLTLYEDMLSAFLAALLLVLTGLFAVRWIRRRMRYETWYYLHLTTYLILVLAYGHQFANGEELSGRGFGSRYWISLYLFVIACLLYGRVVAPALLNARHHFRLAEVVQEGAGMVSLYIAGRDLDRLRVRAGQYFRWRFLTRGQWWQAHPFSLSEAPNGKWLRLTVKIVGDHTAALPKIRPGTRVLAEGPSGVFTANRRVTPRALLIAAGSGIAPIRALLEDLPNGTIVLYRATTEAEIVFREELAKLAQKRGARVEYVIGARTDEVPQRVMSATGLRQLVPDLRNRDVYLCGPPALMTASLQALRRLRMPRQQIHLDPFEF